MTNVNGKERNRLSFGMNRDYGRRMKEEKRMIFVSLGKKSEKTQRKVETNFQTHSYTSFLSLMADGRKEIQVKESRE